MAPVGLVVVVAAALGAAPAASAPGERTLRATSSSQGVVFGASVDPRQLLKADAELSKMTKSS